MSADVIASGIGTLVVIVCGIAWITLRRKGRSSHHQMVDSPVPAQSEPEIRMSLRNGDHELIHVCDAFDGALHRAAERTGYTGEDYRWDQLFDHAQTTGLLTAKDVDTWRRASRVRRRVLAQDPDDQPSLAVVAVRTEDFRQLIADINTRADDLAEQYTDPKVVPLRRRHRSSPTDFPLEPTARRTTPRSGKIKKRIARRRR